MWEAGVEPASRTWQARTLDQLSYSHENVMSQTGLKPATSCFGDRRSDSTELLARVNGLVECPGLAPGPFACKASVPLATPATHAIWKFGPGRKS